MNWIDRYLEYQDCGVPARKIYRHDPNKWVVKLANRRTEFLERHADKIAMREGGASLHDIGVAFGITRERVRQILNKMERPDLIGRFGNYWDNHSPVTKPCAICKTPFTVPRWRADDRHTCSYACTVNHRGPSDSEADRGPVIYAMRIQGATWPEIGDFFGVAYPGLFYQLKRWGTKTDTDVSAAFPGAMNPEHKRRAQEGLKRWREAKKQAEAA